jgi:hypothetical protein
MSLKARLRIAIVALVTLVVIAMSVLYLYDFVPTLSPKKYAATWLRD